LGTLVTVSGDETYNPFAEAFGLTYDNYGVAERGPLTGTDTSSVYGFESLELGVDVSTVLEQNTGSGAPILSGVYWMEIDYSKSFYMEMRVRVKNSSGTVISDEAHVWTHDSNRCSFDYKVNGAPAKSKAFLAGGKNGWITPDCSGPSINVNCEGIVTQSIATLLVPPAMPLVDPDKGFKECCYTNLVLGHTTENESIKNDYSDFLFTKILPADTIDLVLERNGGVAGGGTDHVINDNTYGIYDDFGTLTDHSNKKGLLIQWQKVLISLGEGNYQLRNDSLIIGVSFTARSNTYTLKTYSQSIADFSIRVESVMNGYIEETNTDYTGLNRTDSLRFKGFFGNRKPKYENENVVFSDKSRVPIRRDRTHTYTMQTLIIPDCITSRLIEYHFMANDISFTDYNSNNHSYRYNEFTVTEPEVEDIDYKVQVRGARMSAIFSDKKLNKTQTNC
jgi:hypothetical protein